MSSRPFHARAGDFGLHGQEAATADGTWGLSVSERYCTSLDKGDRTAITDDPPFEASGVHALGASLVSNVIKG